VFFTFWIGFVASILVLMFSTLCVRCVLASCGTLSEYVFGSLGGFGLLGWLCVCVCVFVYFERAIDPRQAVTHV
jgi:hypothetical protein